MLLPTALIQFFPHVLGVLMPLVNLGRENLCMTLVVRSLRSLMLSGTRGLCKRLTSYWVMTNKTKID